MNPSKEELLNRYSQLNDEELVALWTRKTLTDFAQEVLTEELKSRGIEPQASHDTEVPELEMIDAGSLVTLTRYFNATQAHILRARLEAENIPAFVFDEHMVTANWFLSPMIGGARVQVPQAFIQQASLILHQIESDHSPLQDNDDT
jgi:Putative prokaryotic signal transducing protein